MNLRDIGERCTHGMLVTAIALAGCADGDGLGVPATEDTGFLYEDQADEAVGDGLELGQSTAALSTWWDGYASSCSDPTGTDSVLAALAVATARELRRWQPLQDFVVSNGMLALSSLGKARCADGKCYNTQALLDLQRSSAENVQIRPGVRVSPTTLRTRLTWNWHQQSLCGVFCSAPTHEFQFVREAPGTCDMNYWFEVYNPRTGAPLSYGLRDLMDKLIWVDLEDNSYIKFQTSGSTVAIDPTYGLNETSSMSTGSCSTGCIKISSSDVSGQCCSCNGTKKFSRTSWNPSTYLCQ